MHLPWYPIYWEDYSRKTLHHSQGQHGAHLLCLRYIYTTGNSIPHSNRYLIAQAHSTQEKKNADSVLQECFVREGDVWRNPRADEVRAEAHVLHATRSTAGRNGGLKRAANARRQKEDASGQPSSSASSSAGYSATSRRIDEIEAELEAMYEAHPNTTSHGCNQVGNYPLYSQKEKDTHTRGGDANGWDGSGDELGEVRNG